MKKRFLMCVFCLVAVFALVACGSKFNAEKTVATFDQDINTTVKLSYVADFKVDVQREGGNAGMTSFMRDVTATVNVEMDLGADLYIKVSKERKDLIVGNEVTKTEELLYKKDGKYYYQTSSSAAVEVPASDAKAKLEEILENATYEQIGGLSLEALLYNSLDKSYELAVFGLSDTFTTEDLAAPAYSEGANGGLHVDYKPEYVGYKTDGGWSDFSNSTDGYSAVVAIDTNNKGQVTNWKETYNTASLVFNIMSNPPLVVITGERSFTATYGEALSKVESVALTPSTAHYEAAQGGTFVVKTCANGDYANMSDVANGGELAMGKILCIKPAAAEGYEIDSVSVNGSTNTMIEPAKAAGFYCFPVAVGKNNIVVTFKAAEQGEETTAPTAKYADAKGGTYVVKTCANGDFGNMSDVANGGELALGKIICIKPAPAEGYEVDYVVVNGSAQTLIEPAKAAGFYCFNVAEGVNEIYVAFKATNVTAEATLSYTLPANGLILVKTCAMGDFGNMTEYVNGEAIEVGKILCVKPIAFAGYVVDTVTVNGSSEPMLEPAKAGGFYCFNVAAGVNTVTVTYKAAE
mgnify:CR=1 FL=1